MRRRPWGLTLLEALFAMLMILLVLSGLSSALNQAAMVKKNTQNMDQAIEEFHALMLLKGDALAARSVQQPSAGSNGNRLQLKKIDPSLSFETRGGDVDVPNDPYEATEEIDVTYEISGGALVRQINSPSTGSVSERLLTCEDFRVDLDNATSPLLTLQLDIKGTRVTKTRTLKIAMFAP